MDIHALRSAVTVVAFLAFVGLLVWSCMPARQKEFDEAAAMPFLDEEAGS
jgi:cytochrome c oxidase cbb3-type subunit 4